MANSKVSIEVCSNTEWVRENDLDTYGIPEDDLNAAADHLAAGVYDALDKAGFDVEWSKGNRSTYHGWNGASIHTRLGCIGSFASLTADQVDAINDALKSAAEKTRNKFIQLNDYSYRTDSESGEIGAVDFDDACDQLRKMLPEAVLADGAWGWVEDLDGDRFEIGIQPGKVAGL